MNRKLLTIGILVLIILMAGCSNAGRYDKDGKKSFESGDYEKAADSFHKAVEKNPNRADYYVDYGMALIALGQYKDAIKQFDRVYINKDMSIVKENNKMALRGKGIACFRMQDYENAIKIFDKALLIDVLPKLNVDILYYMGNSYRAIGDYQKAVDTYTTILSKDKKNVVAFAERAICYDNLKIMDKSLADYNSAISLEPENFNYYFDKYNLLIENGDKSGAEDVLEKAAKIKIETDTDKYNLAKLHYYQGDYSTALTEFNKCVSKGFKEADYYIGEIYRSKKDFEKAIYYYENYIKTGTANTSNVYNQIGVCLIKTGEYKKAANYLEKGIAYGDTGTLKFLKKNVITAYENMGDFDTAKEILKDYLKNYPNDKEALHEKEFIDTRINKPQIHK